MTSNLESVVGFFQLFMVQKGRRNAKIPRESEKTPLDSSCCSPTGAVLLMF